MSLNVVFLLILLGGWGFSKIFKKMQLPSILGMVVFGILCSLFLKTSTPKLLWDISPFLKSLALIVILLRAGLGISKRTLKKTGKTALMMSFIPCLLEGTALTFTFHYFFNFDWYVSGLTAFMLSAVSPAVIVPSMLDLKERGYGTKNDVPTIILAGASVDDVFAITIFSAFLGLSLSNNINLFKTALSIPFYIILGILSGVIVAYFLIKFLKRHHEAIRATEKLIILLAMAMLLVEAGKITHIAALLGVMSMGFVMLQKSEKIAHELSLKLSKLWVAAEIILFVLIGYSVDVDVALSAGLKGLLAIIIGLVFRSFGVIISTSFSKLNYKERLFCVISYLPKATVQAALGSVALSNGIKEGEVILAIAVLSILFTAPLGLILIRFFSKRLLDIKL